ncbi:MAG: hypothetical protein AB7G11_01000 [Phycisphaerales bacterium]
MIRVLNKLIPAAPGARMRQMVARVMLGVVIAAGCAPILGMALTPPEPEAIPRRWQLEIEPGPLRLTTVETDGVPHAYFYLTYRVINNSGEDLLFAPSFELSTEYGSFRSGIGVPTHVTRELLKETENKYIEDQISIIGQLMQGKENAKDGLVIWPANNLNVNSMTVFAAGFSGETTSVEMPATKERVVLRKTLQIKYHASGDMSQMLGEVIEREESPRWIMR